MVMNLNHVKLCSSHKEVHQSVYDEGSSVFPKMNLLAPVITESQENAVRQMDDAHHGNDCGSNIEEQKTFYVWGEIADSVGLLHYLYEENTEVHQGIQYKAQSTNEEKAATAISTANNKNYVHR